MTMSRRISGASGKQTIARTPRVPYEDFHALVLLQAPSSKRAQDLPG